MKIKPKYAGKDSKLFWKKVDKLKEDHHAMYSLGCALQILENYVLEQLKKAK